MKSWLKKILKIIPIKTIVDYVLEWLAEEAEKTETEIDDVAVETAKIIFDAALGKG